MDNQIIDMINDNVSELRKETREGFRELNVKMDALVTKETCDQIRSNCNKKEEWSVKKITAISSAVIAGIGAATTLVLTIAKLFGIA